MPPQSAKPAPPAAKKPTRIKVRAVRAGYYEHVRRRVGDVFVYAFGEVEAAANRKSRERLGLEDSPLPTWVEAVPANVPERTTTTQEALNQQLEAEREQKASDRAASGTDAEVL